MKNLNFEIVARITKVVMANPTRWESLNIKQISELLKSEGFDVCDSSIRKVFSGLGIEIMSHRRAATSQTVRQRERRIAGLLSKVLATLDNFKTETGVESSVLVSEDDRKWLSDFAGGKKGV